MMNSSDDICLECGHKRSHHDGIGCNDQNPDGSPCLCDVCVDKPSSEATLLPTERLRAILQKSQQGR